MKGYMSLAVTVCVYFICLYNTNVCFLFISVLFSLLDSESCRQRQEREGRSDMQQSNLSCCGKDCALPGEKLL